MQRVAAKFNLYDHLAYILVGLYQIIFGYAFYHFLILEKATLPNFLTLLSVGNILAILLLSYFAGHIIQSFDVIFKFLTKIKCCFETEDDIKIKISENFAFVKKKARRIFDLSSKVNEADVYQYCCLSAYKEGVFEQINIFTALHSLYRGLFMSAFLNPIFIIIFLAYERCIIGKEIILNNKWLLLLIVSQIILAIMFFNRKNKFFEYLSKKVYVTFDIISKDLIK